MDMKKVRKVIIMGAAGRDFHNFNVLFRNNPNYKVVGFTAAQIPHIENRTYPKELAGPSYPKGIRIFPEDELKALISKKKVDLCVLSYSDLSNQTVMEKAATVNSAGADFMLIAPSHTMLRSRKPVISVCAVRTGCGKSQTTRWVVQRIKRFGLKPVVVRHPMPYGDLKKQMVQRFAGYEDLDKYNCTIEEREEYEQHIKDGTVVYAGVDYERILRSAEKEGDVIVWDGGNNDTPFFKPDLHIVVTDALRPDHERTYYPGLTNLMMADIVIINKENTAPKENIERIIKNIRRFNRHAKIVHADSVLKPDKKIKRGSRVMVIEDGPTLTHGGMPYGAGYVIAKRYGARIVDASRYAAGEIKDVYRTYPHLKNVLPAMGYSEKQIADLRTSILNAKPDAVIAGTPINLERLLKIDIPVVHVRYSLKPKNNLLTRVIKDAVTKFVTNV